MKKKNNLVIGMLVHAQQRRLPRLCKYSLLFRLSSLGESDCDHEVGEHSHVFTYCAVQSMPLGIQLNVAIQ